MKTKNNKGFSLLLAVLVGSLLISVGLGFFNLTYKESIISASGRESEFALYAADSGIECVLYADVGVEGVADYFGLESTYNDVEAGLSAGAFDCNSLRPEIPDEPIFYRSGSTASTTLRYGFDDSEANPCVEVEIGRHVVGAQLVTIIQARGYNTCDEGNPRRVERGLYIKY